ncbi:hypothetical protein A2U01_0044677, partial [Trifolium medium]|nr:hypothetical protein [Trifolium medium]
MVRGRALGFDRDAINEYLGNPYQLQGDDGLCPYGHVLAKGNWNVQAMTEKLLILGCTFRCNRVNQPLRAMRDEMKVKVQLVLLFILYNLLPRSHLSDAPMNIAGLLYMVTAGTDVDIARVISNEMKAIACSGVTDLARPKCPLAYPALIMGLIKKVRILIPPLVHEHLGVIDDRHVVRHCKAKQPEQ